MIEILKVRETRARPEHPVLRPFSTFLTSPPSPLFVRRARDSWALRGDSCVQKERGEGGGGRRRNAGEYNGYAKTEEAFMERRHVFPRAIPPPLLRAPLIPGLDRPSRKLGRSKFSLPTNFLLERKEEERRGEVIFLMFLFPSSFLLLLLCLLLSSLRFIESSESNLLFRFRRWSSHLGRNRRRER